MTRMSIGPNRSRVAATSQSMSLRSPTSQRMVKTEAPCASARGWPPKLAPRHARRAPDGSRGGELARQHQSETAASTHDQHDLAATGRRPPRSTRRAPAYANAAAQRHPCSPLRRRHPPPPICNVRLTARGRTAEPCGLRGATEGWGAAGGCSSSRTMDRRPGRRVRDAVASVNAGGRRSASRSSHAIGARPVPRGRRAASRPPPRCWSRLFRRTSIRIRRSRPAFGFAVVNRDGSWSTSAAAT